MGSPLKLSNYKVGLLFKKPYIAIITPQKPKVMQVKSYYTVAVKVKYEDAKGKVKTKTERYLVEAVSVTDSEALMVEYMTKLGEKDYEISSSAESRIVDVIAQANND